MEQFPQRPEVQPTVEIETYQFRHVDLELINTAQLREMMIERPHDVQLTPYLPDLPSPILRSDFSYYPLGQGERSLWGSVEFDPILAKENDQDTKSWIKQLFNHIQDAVEDEGLVDPTYTMKLDHDPNTLYMLVNPDTYAAIIASAGPNRCYINIETYPVDTITRMAGIDLPYEDPTDLIRVDPYEALSNTAQIWALAHNSVIDLFGIPGKHRPKTHLGLQIINEDELSAPRAYDPTRPDNIPHIPNSDQKSHMPILELLPPESVTFSSIGGSHQAVARLREIKTLYTPENRALARSMGINISSGGIILYGPPGTGKSLLMKAFGNEINAEVITINSEEVIEKWVGNSGINIASLFEDIKEKTTPVLIVMDEFDTLGVAPNYASSSERLDVTNILKRKITELSEPQYDHIFIATATNNIDRVDPALIRSGRLEKIYVGLPNQSERADIWACLLNERFKDQVLELASEYADEALMFHSGIQYANDVDPMALALLTDDMSGADINAIIENTWSEKFLRVIHDPSENHLVSIADLKKNVTNLRQSL